MLLLGADDDARRALHLLLDRRGLHVVAAADVEAAKRHMASEPCDVVLVASALAAEIRAACEVPVIAVVASRDVAAAMSLLEAGVDDVMTEPLDELRCSGKN